VDEPQSCLCGISVANATQITQSVLVGGTTEGLKWRRMMVDTARFVLETVRQRDQRRRTDTVNSLVVCTVAVIRSRKSDASPMAKKEFR